MYKRKYIHFLNDIFTSSEKILSLVEKKSFDEFLKDWVIVDAIIRNLEIIGEATKHLPKDLKQKYVDIEWKKIIGLRDVLSHEYFGINYKILWDIIKNKIPELREQIKKIIEDVKKREDAY